AEKERVHRAVVVADGRESREGRAEPVLVRDRLPDRGDRATKDVGQDHSAGKKAREHVAVGAELPRRNLLLLLLALFLLDLFARSRSKRVVGHFVLGPRALNRVARIGLDDCLAFADILVFFGRALLLVALALGFGDLSLRHRSVSLVRASASTFNRLFFELF